MVLLAGSSEFLVSLRGMRSFGRNLIENGHAILKLPRSAVLPVVAFGINKLAFLSPRAGAREWGYSHLEHLGVGYSQLYSDSGNM